MLRYTHDMTDWQDREAAVLFQTYRRQPVVITRGEGTRVWDDEGKSYLDFIAGVAVNALGHASPVVTNALVEQAKQVVQVSNHFYNTPMIELAEILVKNSCLDRVFFCNSGTEAIEACLKLARRWGGEHRNGAFEIITADNAFHGRTFGSVTAGGSEKYSAPFAPLPGGFVHVPFGDVAAIRAATNERTAAVLIEPIQGEAGVNVPPAGYLKAVRDWCTEAGILFMLDEVQTGVARTGRLFAYEHEGAEPDVMALAKGLGSGVPIGAMLAKEHCAAFHAGDHGTTFGGNPLMTAVARDVMRHIIDNDISSEVAAKGERLATKLHGLEDRHAEIVEVRGIGLLRAVEFSSEISGRVTEEARARGLLLNPVKPTAVRLMPPLLVTDEELDEAVAILDEAISAATAG